MKNFLKNKNFWFFSSLAILFAAIFFIFFFNWTISYKLDSNGQIIKAIPPLNKIDYNVRLNLLAHTISTSTISTTTIAEIKNSTTSISFSKSTSSSASLWPVKTVYPNPGALLPFNRIVAYYGNLSSKAMGALGQYPEEEMLSRLRADVQKWELADPNTPVIPALQYIAITAQKSPGVDGKYRLRMPDTEIDKVIEMAKKVNGLVFLDLQIGQSTIQDELPLLEKYMKMPQVHLAIDPEFSMKNGRIPGIYVGVCDAVDINYAIDYLAKIVQDNNLSPKLFVVHRYRLEMVTNYKLIKTVPEVQIIMDMDGWGPLDNKLGSYIKYIYKEPVQFTGFKLFYRNDTWKPSTGLMTPEEILKLTPSPIYIQYQ